MIARPSLRVFVGAPSGAMSVSCGSDFSRDASLFTLLRRAASLPFFTRLRASESLFFVWPKKSNQKKGHPAIAPYAQSLCYGCARPLRGSPTVRPWTDVELAHIVWATLRADPAQPRRDRGGPLRAHPARQSRSQSQSSPIRLRHLPPLRGRRKIRSQSECCELAGICFVLAAQDAQ